MGAESSSSISEKSQKAGITASLLELLIASLSPLLPVHSPLRRATVYLLRRGLALVPQNSFGSGQGV
ncbi:unnamed protein product [Cylicocyclus nassatus]|uniref:Uncharacterized protein n=1 Tax=Cylicocyclus nassatus TaxID=53992 RepID=A0AA36M3G4_CYLNA|nr:unnamed protein product [Cylicocyclus nassatus]